MQIVIDRPFPYVFWAGEKVTGSLKLRTREVINCRGLRVQLQCVLAFMVVVCTRLVVSADGTGVA